MDHILPEPVNLSDLNPIPQPSVGDYHCHCDYSMDAIGTIDEYCQAAIARNLAEICFTTHFDMPKSKETAIEEGCYVVIKGKKLPTEIDVMTQYVDEVRQAHDKYYAIGLSVQVGMEFGWYKNCEETAEKVREKYNLDYLLCGLHHINDVFIEHSFDSHSPEEMAEIYFTDMISAAKTGLFDTIAHLDYYRKLGYDFYGDIVDKLHEPYLSDLFEALKSTGTGIELNTRALKYGLKEYYPRMEIVNQAKRAGVTMNRLGSDAHAPVDVALDFENAANIIPPFIAEDAG